MDGFPTELLIMICRKMSSLSLIRLKQCSSRMDAVTTANFRHQLHVMNEQLVLEVSDGIVFRRLGNETLIDANTLQNEHIQLLRLPERITDPGILQEIMNFLDTLNLRCWKLQVPNSMPNDLLYGLLAKLLPTQLISRSSIFNSYNVILNSHSIVQVKLIMDYRNFTIFCGPMLDRFVDIEIETICLSAILFIENLLKIFSECLNGPVGSLRILAAIPSERPSQEEIKRKFATYIWETQDNVYKTTILLHANRFTLAIKVINRVHHCILVSGPV